MGPLLTLTMYWILLIVTAAICAPTDEPTVYWALENEADENSASDGSHWEIEKLVDKYFDALKITNKLGGRVVENLNFLNEKRHDQTNDLLPSGLGMDNDHVDLEDDYTNRANALNSAKKEVTHTQEGTDRTRIRYVQAIREELLNSETDLAMDTNRHKRDTQLNEVENEPVLNVDLEMVPEYYSYNGKLMTLQDIYQKKGGVCSLISGYRDVPMYVISRCPIFSPSSNIKTLCEHQQATFSTYHENVIDIAKTPVQDEEGFVYRNIYCAQCNGKINIQAWFTKVDCDDFQPLEISDGREHLMLLDEAMKKSQTCTRQLHPAIPKMIQDCSTDEIYVFLNHQIRIGGAHAQTDISPFPLSFSILMNFGFDGKTLILFSMAESESNLFMCEENEMYDPVNKKCRKISCDHDYHLVDGVCRKEASADEKTTQDELSELRDIDEMVQVTLTIRNISKQDILLLNIPGMDTLLSSTLAQKFSISENRIQNMTMNVVNSTDLQNGSSTKNIEIHRFPTPQPVAIKDFAAKIKNDPLIKFVEHMNKNNETYDQLSASNVNTSSWKHRGDETAKPFIDALAVVDDDANGETVDDSLSQGDDKLTDTTENKNVSRTLSSHKNNDYYDDVDYPLSKTTEDPTNFLNQPLNVSLQILFILLPSHQIKSAPEQSVENIIQSMNDLATKRTFSITLNGTHLQVEDVWNAPNPTSLDKFCTHGLQLEFDDRADFVIMPYTYTDTNTTVTTVYVNATDRLYFPREYDLTLFLNGIVGNLKKTQEDGLLFVCHVPNIEDETCSRIVLNQSEYQLLANKYVIFANRVYNMSEYEFVNEVSSLIRVCAPETWSAEQLLFKWEQVCGDDLGKLVAAESFLTFILGVISLLFLSTVLVTYSIFEKLRNLPGMNTMNLTLSLFLGEFVFITSGWIQPHQEWLCSSVGILLHYLFLTSFFWMNVMSFDVFRTFARKCLLRRIRDKKTYVPRYSLYAWGTPFLIVAVCVFLDYSNVLEGMEIGYGGMSQNSEASRNDTIPVVGCWIQNPIASMIAFGGPMMLVLFSNAVMFIRTIICIRTSTKITRKSIQRSSLSHMTGHDDVMLYVRMSTVMGFTWVFGLASSFVSALSDRPTTQTCVILHLLCIFFIVFNCSQGVFIFFAFVCKRRVFALYRGLLHRLKSGRQRKSTMSSSRGTLSSTLSQGSLSHIT